MVNGIRSPLGGPGSPFGTGRVERVPAAPVNVTLPSIEGTPNVGYTLTANRGGWTGHPAPTYTYQWQADGVDIPGETGATYVVDAADVGAELTVEVTATNSEGSAMAESAGVTGSAFAPINTVLPTISGTPEVGETLTATTGTWSAYPTPPSYAYQWNRDGSPIGSATASTYVLVEADAETDIMVTVTATNSEGSTPATSAATTIDPYTPPVGGDPAYLLETGDTFLLETGDRLLLEA